MLRPRDRHAQQPDRSRAIHSISRVRATSLLRLHRRRRKERTLSRSLKVPPHRSFRLRLAVPEKPSGAAALAQVRALRFQAIPALRSEKSPLRRSQAVLPRLAAFPAISAAEKQADLQARAPYPALRSTARRGSCSIPQSPPSRFPTISRSSSTQAARSPLRSPYAPTALSPRETSRSPRLRFCPPKYATGSAGNFPPGGSKKAPRMDRPGSCIV